MCTQAVQITATVQFPPADKGFLFTSYLSITLSGLSIAGALLKYAVLTAFFSVVSVNASNTLARVRGASLGDVKMRTANNQGNTEMATVSL